MMPLIILAVSAAVIVIGAIVLWPKIGSFFRDSETLFWARLQMAAGLLWGVLVTTNLAPFLDVAGLGRWGPFILALQGVVTEIARRSRATDL